MADRSALSFEGELAERLLDAPAEALPMLRSLAILDGRLSGLVSALETAEPEPWTRATMLRGGGWSICFLELTARCNERCTHCYAESTPEREEALPWDRVAEVVDAVARMGFTRLQLTGGDPLIADTCCDAAERAVAAGVPQLEVYTNGVALRGRTFERLRDVGASFAFSFYSHRAEVHDAITRHPGSSVRTLAAIERVLDAGLDARVSIVAMEANAADVPATVEHLLAMGLDRSAIAIDVLRTVGRGADGTAPPYPDVQVGGGTTTHGAERRDAFLGRVAVRADGAVVPCIFQRDAVLGSVFEQPLDAILESPVPIPAPEPPSAERMRELGLGLACTDCRMRSHVLGATMELVALRTGRET